MRGSGHLGVGVVGELLDIPRRALEGDDGAGAGIGDERGDRCLVERLRRDPRARTHPADFGPPPETGGIAASSSPAAIGASSSAYSRFTAIRSGSCAARSPTCRIAPERRDRVGDGRTLGQLDLDRFGACALAEHREEANGNLHDTTTDTLLSQLKLLIRSPRVRAGALP